MSAALLGCYDSFKKQALKENAVIPVLFLNTLFSSLIFLPFIVIGLAVAGFMYLSILVLIVAGFFAFVGGLVFG